MAKDEEILTWIANGGNPWLRWFRDLGAWKKKKKKKIIVNWKVSIVSYKLKKDFQVVIYNWITESTRRHLLRNKYTLVARFKKIFLLICELLQASSDSKKKKINLRNFFSDFKGRWSFDTIWIYSFHE